MRPTDRAARMLRDGAEPARVKARTRLDDDTIARIARDIARQRAHATTTGAEGGDGTTPRDKGHA